MSDEMPLVLAAYSTLVLLLAVWFWVGELRCLRASGAYRTRNTRRAGPVHGRSAGAPAPDQGGGVMIDQYRGHICVTRDPGCTCGDHAEALRERDRLRVELAAERERADALGRAADGMAEGVEYEHRECDASVCLRKAEVVAYRETMGGEGA